MLRVISNLSNLKLSVQSLPSNLQIVRHRRKPRWVPKAKSKIFRVPPKVERPLDEHLEMMRLYNNYRTQIKSLRKYFYFKYNLKYLKSEDPEEQKRIYQEDFARCMKINDEWNAELKIEREAMLENQLQERVEAARKRVEELQILKVKKLELVEEIVRKEKESSKSFILRENIDEAIENAINNVVDYNFAIEKDGSRIVGRETKPQKDEKEKVKFRQ